MYFKLNRIVNYFFTALFCIFFGYLDYNMLCYPSSTIYLVDISHIQRVHVFICEYFVLLFTAIGQRLCKVKGVNYCFPKRKQMLHSFVLLDFLKCQTTTSGFRKNNRQCEIGSIGLFQKMTTYFGNTYSLIRVNKRFKLVLLRITTNEM